MPCRYNYSRLHVLKVSVQPFSQDIMGIVLPCTELQFVVCLGNHLDLSVISGRPRRQMTLQHHVLEFKPAIIVSAEEQEMFNSISFQLIKTLHKLWILRGGVGLRMMATKGHKISGLGHERSPNGRKIAFKLDYSDPGIARNQLPDITVKVVIRLGATYRISSELLHGAQTDSGINR